MSVMEYIDEQIKTRLIEGLLAEYERTGFLTTPSPERKSQIIEEIATLRASMSPQIQK
jgi:hypothetical protein